MPEIKENLLSRLPVKNTTGLLFMFFVVFIFGIVLVTIGTVAIVRAVQRHNHSEYAKQIIYQPNAIVSASSNEQANPGVIAFFLNGSYAAAILEDGSFTAAETAPSGGTLTILVTNPENTELPTSVRYSAQTITLTDDTDTMTICLPEINGTRLLWVDKSGNTYLEPTLTLLARGC